MEVYNQAARPLIANVLIGYNATIFAYGQTGTGKTFTMEGEPTAPELRGIIPNSFAHIFGNIAKESENKKYIDCQFLPVIIYNEVSTNILITGFLFEPVTLKYITRKYEIYLARI